MIFIFGKSDPTTVIASGGCGQQGSYPTIQHAQAEINKALCARWYPDKHHQYHLGI